ncbi:hypothetical protein HY468_04495 [Candidatus Roizmanbacteria bacterium]|nr:hypothetical protein [Candidatus Roizmanbacteria bacterium]
MEGNREWSSMGSVDEPSNFPEDLLLKMLVENPALYQYVDDSAVQRAVQTHRNLRAILNTNPQIVTDVKGLHGMKPDHVVMAIVPHLPLVVSATSQRISAMAPVLSCTLNAIDDLSIPRGKYGVFESLNTEDDLMIWMWGMAERNPRRILTYDSSVINATNYIAFGASRMLTDEVFHRTFEYA